mgnify:CR=1 FL=1
MSFKDLIAPAMDIADIHIKAEDGAWLPIDPDGKAFMKPLWTSADSGGWAVLYRWKSGYEAPPHKHLGAIHVYVVSGKLQVRGAQLCAGDYVYEPNGVIHERTLALEDSVHLNIGDGPILFFDDNGITHYFSWEQIEQLQSAAGAENT